MTSTKAGKLTDVSLAVFRLNGLLLEWGDGFCLPHGLTSARWQVLGAIAMSPQPPTAPQMADAMGITRQGVQKQINLLVREGLIQPRPNPGHKRSSLYALTKNGEKIYQKLHQRWQQHVQEIAARFNVSELETTIRVLMELSRTYSSIPYISGND